MASVEPEKLETVYAWLREVYGGNHIPPFEVNQRTVTILLQLAEAHRRRKVEAEIHAALLQRFAAEFGAEACRLEKVLGSLGITPTHLSQSGLSSLRSVSTLANTLSLKDTELSSFYAALNQLTRRQKQGKSSLNALIERHESLGSELAQAEEERLAMEKYLSQLRDRKPIEEQEKIGRKKEIHYLSQKGDDYSNRIASLKDSIQKSGFRSDLEHGALVQQSKEVESGSKTLEFSQEKLRAYHDLPPDILLARVKLEEARSRLRGVEAQISQSVDGLGM